MISAASGILCKNRGAGKPKEVVVLKWLGDSCVHLAKLRAMTFIEDKDNVLLVDIMGVILGNESIDFWMVVMMILHCRLPVAFAIPCRGVTVGSTFLEPFILLHGLISKSFRSTTKRTLSMRGIFGGQLCSLETGQGFTEPVVCQM